METLTQYIRSGRWLELYKLDERDHVLFFFYSLFRWLERDTADYLEFTNHRFAWKSEGNSVGDIEFKVQPSPSFLETLLLILGRDNFISQRIKVKEISEDNTICIVDVSSLWSSHNTTK
jgi:hypothetical protein